MYRRFSKVILGLVVHITPSIFFRRILRSEALVYKSYFFSEHPFYGNYSTLFSHTITVISHAFAYSSRCRRKPWQGLLLKIEREDSHYIQLWEQCIVFFKTEQLLQIGNLHPRHLYLVFMKHEKHISITLSVCDVSNDCDNSPFPVAKKWRNCLCTAHARQGGK